MGNFFGKQEDIDQRWCTDASRSCAQCIANDLTFPASNSIKYQLLRLSMAFSRDSLEPFVVDENKIGCTREKFVAAIKAALPGPENTRSFWIIHYSPAMTIVSKSEHRETFVVMDRTALYLFMLPSACCGGCGTMQLVNFQEIRIPLLSITGVSASTENEEDFTVTAMLRIARENPLQWRDGTQLRERTITLHSTRRTEVLRSLRGMLNVLHYGEPVSTRKCQWKDMPASVAALGEIVPEEYLDQRAGGCFEAKFLAQVYSAPACDEGCDVPSVWAATSPAFLHVYRHFFRPDFKCTAYIPRPLGGLYEYDAVGLDRPEPFSCPAMWADVANAKRLESGCPPYRLPGLVESCANQLLARTPAGTVRIFDLHGSEYCRSTHTAILPAVTLARNASEPGYAGCADGSALAGGTLWHGPSERSSPRLVGSEQVIQSALRALAHTPHVRNMTFERICLTTHDAALAALSAMADICRTNTHLAGICFPYVSADGGAPLQPAVAAKYAAAWKNVAEALLANPKPQFVSFDFSGSRLNDAAVSLLVPALIRLFSASQCGLRPVSLCFKDNDLTAAGVAALCDKVLKVADLSALQSLSFGGNEWTDAGSGLNAVEAVIAVVKKCPALMTLDVQAKYRYFPGLPALHAALAGTACPLEEISIGGAPVVPPEMDGWIDAVIAIADAKALTLKRMTMHGLQLNASAAVRLLSRLPSVAVDLSGDAINGAFPGDKFSLASSVLVRELQLAKNAHYVLQWWTTMPRLLVALDLSDTNVPGDIPLFDALSKSLRTLTGSIALQSLNIARVSVRGKPAQLNALTDLLAALLVNDFVRLKTLDMTGCGSGPTGLSALGACLRKNRTLTSLHYDGQSSSNGAEVFQLAEGWKALRGCFYGNKKIVEMSYPWSDITAYFGAVAATVEQGMRQAADVKGQIGVAHRAGNMGLKRSKIQEIIAIKKHYKTCDRVRIKSVRTMYDIYESVRVNAVQAALALERKLADKRANPQADALREKITAKMLVLLGKLREHLTKLAGKRTTADTHVEAWTELSAGIASGPLLFTPERLRQFWLPVEAIGGGSDLKLGRILNDTDKLVMALVTKAAGYGQTPAQYVDDIARAAAGRFDDLRATNFLDVPLKRAGKNDKKGGKEGDDDTGGDTNDRPEDDGAYVPIPAADRDSIDSATGPAVDHSAAAADPASAVEQYGGIDTNFTVELGGNQPTTQGSSSGNQVYAAVNQRSYAAPTALALANKAVTEFPIYLKKQWSDAINGAMDKSAEVLLHTLEYSGRARFICTKLAGPQSQQRSACTLVTQCSVDRLPRLKKQARAWAGRLSVAVYISTASATEKAAGLAAVQALVRELDEDATYSGSLVVSVLYGHEDSPWLWDCTTPGAADGALYPINALRNLAASVVQSALMFLVDVDFVPSAGLEQCVQRAAVEQDLLVRCGAGELVVVPAFERMVAVEDAEAEASNLSLEAVCAGLEEGSVTAFHVKHFPAGHFPTNYAKWRELSAQPALQTPAPQYEVAYGDYYEPYVIMARSRFVAYDERFRGYGMNKCVHLRALAERGCTFHVLPGHFLVADAHGKSVAHQRTYGSQSGYRKHVVAAAYRAALRDIQAGAEPAVSKATARLLRLARKSSKTEAWKAKAVAMKKEMKKVMVQVMQAGMGDVLEGTSAPIKSTA